MVINAKASELKSDRYALPLQEQLFLPDTNLTEILSKPLVKLQRSRRALQILAIATAAPLLYV